MYCVIVWIFEMQGPAGKRGTTAGGEEMKHAMSVFCFVNPAYAMAVLVRC